MYLATRMPRAVRQSLYFDGLISPSSNQSDEEHLHLLHNFASCRVASCRFVSRRVASRRDVSCVASRRVIVSFRIVSCCVISSYRVVLRHVVV